MKKITLFMSLLAVIIGLQARAADIYLQTSVPEQVYVYGWGGADFGSWPGTVLTDIVDTPVDGYYHFTVTDGASIILHDSNGHQTGDITDLSGDKYYKYPVDGDFTKYQVIEPITSYTVVGDASLLGSAWDTNAVDNEMEKLEDGTYKLVKNNLTLAVGNYSYKVVGNHDYNVFQLPLSGNNTLNIGKSGEYNVTFTLNTEVPELNAVAELIKEEVIVYDNYTIVGVEALMGSAWNTNAEAGNDMTIQEDGTYKLVKENVELTAGTYDYKVVANHSWGVWELPSSGNQTLAIENAGKYNVTFVLDITKPELSATPELVEETPVEITTYTIVGVEALMGSEWSVAEEAGNDMAIQEDGTYKLVKENVELTAGSYTYKVVGNRDYSVFEYPGANQNNTLTIEKHGIYNVTFTLTLGEETALDAVATLLQEILPDYVLSYGTEGEGAENTFVAGEGDYEGKLVAKDVVIEGSTQFKVKYGETVYGGVPDENEGLYWIHDTWCTNIPLSAGDAAKNFVINEAGTYTFVLTISEDGIMMDVEGFPETPQPETKYLLHYGVANEEWTDAEFIAVENKEGKYVAEDVVFVDNTQFGVKYGDTWYASFANNNDDYYKIHADWCANIPLNTAQDEHEEGLSLKNFIIETAGTYTFTLTVTDEGIKMDVTGFSAAPVLGDLDGDGTADVSDINIMVNMILGKQEKTASADLDLDGEVDVSDVNILVNIILGKVSTTTEE